MRNQHFVIYLERERNSYSYPSWCEMYEDEDGDSARKHPLLVLPSNSLFSFPKARVFVFPPPDLLLRIVGPGLALITRQTSEYEYQYSTAYFASCWSKK